MPVIVYLYITSKNQWGDAQLIFKFNVKNMDF